MTIKNLVISGGGAVGFRYLGILSYLINKSYINCKEIENIFATSIGSFLATSICLGYDMETIINYFVDRPWQEVFKISPLQVLCAYKSKGIFSSIHYEQILSPLLKGKGLNINITLKELFEYSKINLYFNSVEINNINNFETIIISHHNFPDLSLIKVLQMTSSIPYLIEPICIDQKCYTDGGLLINYLSKYCLSNNCKEEETLGLTYMLDNEYNKEDCKINEESTMFDFFYMFNFKISSYLVSLDPPPALANQIVLQLSKSPIDTKLMNDILTTKELRKTWFKDGENDAITFLNSK